MTGRLDERHEPTRREALGSGIATIAALAMGRVAKAAGDVPRAAGYGPFKMGIQSYSLRGFTTDGKPDLGKALKVTNELGLTNWEAFPAHLPMNGDVSAMKKQLADAGVTVLGYGVSHFGKDVDASRKLFEFAKSMRFTYLSADPDPASFDSLDKLVDEYGIAIGIHNHGPGHRYDKIDKIAAAIKDHHPKIGCCIDTGHFLRSNEDPVRAAEVFGNRIYGVHLKDVKAAKTFTILGKGDLRTADLLKTLASLGYGYALALEYEENPADPVAEIRECLAATRTAIAAASSGRPAPKTPIPVRAAGESK
jgi:sugar phosphate isomerase/epimerase